MFHGIFSCRRESQEFSNTKLGTCKNGQQLPTTNVESIFPSRNIILTSSFSNFCKMLLENRDAGTIHYILREIIVHVSHSEDGSSKQANVKLHFKDVVVQLLRVPSFHCISKHLAEPRQKLFEVLVTQA